MDPRKDIGLDNQSSAISEIMQADIDRRLFHLKTLYDVSRELLGMVDVDAILKNFLLMTTGNFGVLEGFIAVEDGQSREVTQLVTVGFEEEERPGLSKASTELVSHRLPGGVLLSDEALQTFGQFPRTVVCLLGFAVDETCSGLLGLGSKLVGEPYTEDDRDLLETLVNNLVVSLKNARASEALKEAYREVTSLNKAKDKVINHLSHELKTPLALLSGAMTQLGRKLKSLPPEMWRSTMERAQRNLERLVEMQYEVEDIMRDRDYKTHDLLCMLLDQCADELETLAAEQVGEGPIVEQIRARIEEIFGPKEMIPEDISMDRFVAKKIDELRPNFAHRQVDVNSNLEVTPALRLPTDPIEKVVKGLVKNAIENTPDEGRVEVAVRNRGGSVELSVRDSGVGVTPEHQKRIFEGFFPTQETLHYSSKKPFDFNAGGKGADLLRAKIFSERFDFKIDMTSSRCPNIPLPSDVCPGRISSCEFCASVEDCHNSGGTTFTVVFSIEPKPAAQIR